jgi:hypothetical protein
MRPRGIDVKPQRSRKHSIAVGLAIYAAFMSAAIAWFSLYQFPQSSIAQAPKSAAAEPSPEERFGGTISMSRGAGGGCRQVKFNNNTGALQETSASACGGDGASSTNSTQGRLDAIRGAFNK